MELKGAVALVTGGAQGIGRAFTEYMLAEGVKVFICDVNASVGEATKKELEAKHGKGSVEFKVCDVTKKEQLEDAFATAMKVYKKLDIVVNNAGIANEEDNGGWEQMIQVNINGVVRGTKLAFKYMDKRVKGQSGGSIVNIASITSISDKWYPLPVYCSTKAFVNQFSRTMATPLHTELTGVRVISINPGLTDTAILNSAEQQVQQDDRTQQAFKNLFVQFKTQTVDNMGKGLVSLLKSAPNGSLWLIEDDMPPKRFTLECNEIKC